MDSLRQRYLRRKRAADLSEQLLPHQQRVVDKIQDPNQEGLVLMHGLGSGKTLSSIAAYNKLNMPTTAVLPASLIGNYEKELDKWVGGTPNNMELRSQQEIARHGMEPDELKNRLLIIDEAHRSRNTSSKLYQALSKQNPSKRLLLTGTPVYNAPHDIAASVNLASGKNLLPERQKDFEQQYIQNKLVHPGFMDSMRGVKPGIRKELVNKERLKRILQKYVDYYEGSPEHMPTLQEETVKVPMSDRQQELYNGVLGNTPWWMQQKIKSGLLPNKQELEKMVHFMSGLRMLSNSTKSFENDPTKVDSVKIQHAYNMLKEKLQQNPETKSVVYSNFLESGLNPYKELLEKDHIPYGEFTGEMNDKVRNQIIRDYNENKLKALLISSAGSEGLDLKGTNLLQILEPHFNRQKERQVIGRTARYMSHDHLPPEQRKVLVQRFLATPRPSSTMRLNPFASTKAPMGADEYLSQMGDEKDRLNQQIIDLIKNR